MADDPRGNVISVTHNYDGYTHVEMDNGPTDVIRLVMPSESYPHFASESPRDIWEALANPTPGSRNKPKHQGRQYRDNPWIRRVVATSQSTEGL